MSIHRYNVGEKAIILIDSPFFADLQKGDVVTILRVTPMPERGYDSYLVTGGWCLNYKVMEPLTADSPLENK